MGWKILLPQDIASEARKYLEDRGHELIMGSGIDEQSICNELLKFQQVFLKLLIN